MFVFSLSFLKSMLWLRCDTRVDISTNCARAVATHCHYSCHKVLLNALCVVSVFDFQFDSTVVLLRCDIAPPLLQSSVMNCEL